MVGYMASGKTTFGRALAKKLGLRHIDLDFYIEQRFRKSISDIFEERGETGFRKIEAEMLREVGEFEGVVVSCGGGTPCFGDNMDYMLQGGKTIWLETSADCIMARLMANRSKRPLMASKSEEELAKAVKEGLEARVRHYSRAEIHIDGAPLETRSEISQTVNRFLSEYPLYN